jgi:hypothetical protein
MRYLEQVAGNVIGEVVDDGQLSLAWNVTAPGLNRKLLCKVKIEIFWNFSLV